MLNKTRYTRVIRFPNSYLFYNVPNGFLAAWLSRAITFAVWARPRNNV